MARALSFSEWCNRLEELTVSDFHEMVPEDAEAVMNEIILIGCHINQRIRQIDAILTRHLPMPELFAYHMRHEISDEDKQAEQALALNARLLAMRKQPSEIHTRVYEKVKQATDLRLSVARISKKLSDDILAVAEQNSQEQANGLLGPQEYLHLKTELS